MACSSMNIPTSQIVVARRDIVGETCGLRRSSSSEDLCKKATIRRSHSDNHLSTSLCATPIRSSKLRPSRSFGIFSTQFSSSLIPSPIRSLLFDTEAKDDLGLVGDYLDDDQMVEEVKEEKVKRANWIERLMELRMQWKGRQEKKAIVNGFQVREEVGDGDDEDGCRVDYEERKEEEERIKFDSDSFSRLLVQVPWSDAKRFSKLAFLCHRAYKIPEIKARELKLHYGLEFVTSSLEKKIEAIALKVKLDKDSTHLRVKNLANLEADSQRLYSTQEQITKCSMAYEIAASAASHVHCNAKNESYSGVCGYGEHSREVGPVPRGCNSEIAAEMAASTMTAVVAAREKEKQEVAKELQSLDASPCEWFICDDPSTCMRYFVIQGSESLAAWQTNLFFEPTKFEVTDALVHRGIYEAAKGIYEQFMPEIEKHIKAYGEDAKVQLTGHSLGGSLSLLVHLMLVERGAVKPSTLLPVVTFGSPFVFCGGEKILQHLGLDEKQVHCVILHRDIVPRAFSCSYPRQVAQLLKRLNSSFRSHPCLNKQKMMYSPLGQLFILQPSEKYSPSHPLLPPGCALYAFDDTQPTMVASALRAFLDTPHPLETLSDHTAYGSEGSILRDHDSHNYATAASTVMKEYAKLAFRNVREQRRLIWPLIASPSHHTWRREGNLANGTMRKEVMTSV